MQWKDKAWKEWLEERGLTQNHPIHIGELFQTIKKLEINGHTVQRGTLVEIIDHVRTEAHTYLVRLHLPKNVRLDTTMQIDLNNPTTNQVKLKPPPKEEKPHGPRPMNLFPGEDDLP